MFTRLIHQAVGNLIQNISKIAKPLCGSFHFTMANNFFAQQVQDLQQQVELPQDPPVTDADYKSDFSTSSVINDIIAQSLASQVTPEPVKQRISFQTLARLVLQLNRAHKKVAQPVPEDGDLEYWRNMAKSRGEMSSRYYQIIEVQRKRIHTLEHDLRTLIGLARETREMLAEIAMEKHASQDRGDGEYPH